MVAAVIIRIPMHERTDDLRIRAVRPLLPPAILAEEAPVTDKAASLVENSRKSIDRCLRGEERRLVVVVGPCSLHDVKAGLEYAERLKGLADRFEDSLCIVMRAYFEKPRTTVGWKGLVNDPDIDESYQINKGLRLARGFLRDLAEIGLPAGTEFLDMTVPQHLADLVSWGAIGARTSESQTHRELASGLSMPVGFKNATDGNTRTAIDAVKAARNPHWFLGATKDGLSAILQTIGNDSCHVILRGGSRTGPNYCREHVSNAAQALEKDGLPSRVMVDFSHANSLKKHERQIEVAKDVAEQLRAGGSPIFGVMIESFLVEGRQDYIPGQPAVYGQSITDACLSWEQTVPVLELLAQSAHHP
jgi:3-deoxy-7-phosphoheptulonate synthase